jgi:hypothetical protein
MTPAAHDQISKELRGMDRQGGGPLAVVFDRIRGQSRVTGHAAYDLRTGRRSMRGRLE